MRILYHSDLTAAEVEAPNLYCCPSCQHWWTFQELEEEAEWIDEILDYWFFSQSCPDCEG